MEYYLKNEKLDKKHLLNRSSKCIKAVLITIFIATFTFSAFCQKQVGRQRNTIYVLDCTGSMNGYNDAPDIWQPTKDFLKSELEKTAKETPNARVVILPFQDKVLSPIKINLKNIEWNKLESVLDEYVKNLTPTNICDSWLTAEKYIDPACDNYIVLMTDGHDNIGGVTNEAQRTAKLAQILESFCGKYDNTNGFYIELTKQASLPTEIKNAIDLCPNLYCIDATKGIPSFGCFSTNIINVNTRDLPLDIPIGFSNAGTFAANIQNLDSKYVKLSIKNDKISQGKIILHIESKFGDNIETLNKAIGAPTTDIRFSLKSDGVIITNPDIKLVLNTKPIRSLDIATDNGVIYSSVKKVKPFLWIKGNPTDTIRWNLKPMFSKEAVSDNSYATFQLKAATDLSKYTILYNGKALSDSAIIIKPDDNALLEIVIPQNEKIDDVDLSLTEINSYNIDRINGTQPNNVSFKLIGDISTSMSLIEIITWIILAIILIFIITWFAFIRNQKYPKFSKGIINIQSPYFAAIHTRGSRMVVLGPTKKKQSWFDRIWKGKVIYHANSCWLSEVEITPSGKNMRFRCPSNQLISDPNPLWTRGANFKIFNPADNSQKIEININ